MNVMPHIRAQISDDDAQPFHAVKHCSYRRSGISHCQLKEFFIRDTHLIHRNARFESCAVGVKSSRWSIRRQMRHQKRTNR